MILADPPWNHVSNSKANPGRNARRHYRTMSLAEICALPVRQLGAKQSILWLWITGPFLAIGAHVRVMKAWGYRPSAVGFTWVKLNPRAPTLFYTTGDFAFGGGHTTRKNCEWAMIGVRGKSLRVSAAVPELIIAPRRKHSQKPETARERIEQYVGPGLKMVDLFSRRDREGWMCWGDQAGSLNG